MSEKTGLIQVMFTRNAPVLFRCLNPLTQLSEKTGLIQVMFTRNAPVFFPVS